MIIRPALLGTPPAFRYIDVTWPSSTLTFTNATQSDTVSTGIFWADAGDHNKRFDFDFTGFAFKTSAYNLSMDVETDATRVAGAVEPQIRIYYHLIDSAGARVESFDDLLLESQNGGPPLEGEGQIGTLGVHHNRFSAPLITTQHVHGFELELEVTEWFTDEATDEVTALTLTLPTPHRLVFTAE